MTSALFRWLPVVFCAVLAPLVGAQEKSADGAADRRYTVEVLDRIARPVLTALAAGELKQHMPFGPGEEKRRDYGHLEAFGRTMAGIAPWLALGADETAEGRLRAEYLGLAKRALVNATSPRSPDRMNFSKGGQPLVDAAFLALALLRAPEQLWTPLAPPERADLVAALQATRVINPPNNNWLLFSALVEAALWKFTGEVNKDAITRALDRHDEWYVGDGTYGDGPRFAWDYYNSFVIQPAILAVLEVCREKGDPLAARLQKAKARAQRYAEVQERMISPEGTYPVIGRSSVYRFGAFQHLALMALRRELTAATPPAAVRGALTAVIRRTLAAPGNFDAQGWLRAGLAGHQPALRESYICTGSLYLCLTGLLHLGLPASDPFWSDPPAPWTQQRIWNGADVPADHGLKEGK